MFKAFINLNGKHEQRHSAWWREDCKETQHCFLRCLSSLFCTAKSRRGWKRISCDSRVPSSFVVSNVRAAQYTDDRCRQQGTILTDSKKARTAGSRNRCNNSQNQTSAYFSPVQSIFLSSSLHPTCFHIFFQLSLIFLLPRSIVDAVSAATANRRNNFFFPFTSPRLLRFMFEILMVFSAPFFSLFLREFSYSMWSFFFAVWRCCNVDETFVFYLTSISLMSWGIFCVCVVFEQPSWDAEDDGEEVKYNNKFIISYETGSVRAVNVFKSSLEGG